MPSGATRAGGGAGRAPGKGAGQLDAYQAHLPSAKPVTTSAAGFDAARSKRIGSAASASSDVYQNPDGSYTRKVFDGPVNFRAGDGSWTPIDTNLAKGGNGRWRQKANGVGVDFAAAADDGLLVSVRVDAGHSVGYGLSGAAKVTPTVSGSTVTYAGVLPGTDVVLTSRPGGEEESLVLHSADVATSWVFPLRLQGVSPRLNADGSVDFLDGGGGVVASIPHGVMSDSKFDPRSGQPASSRAVSYSLTTVAGGPALVMSVDPGWLADPARVFPVVVDPSLNLTSGFSTFAATSLPGNNAGSSLLRVGTSDGGVSVKAYSFLQFASFGSTFNGATLNSVSLNLFDVWAGTCTATPFSVNPVTQAWTPSGVSAYPGPSFGSAIGSLTANPGAACTNTGLNPTTGTWMSVPLSLGTFTSWASGGANNGLAVTASQTDSAQWKQFASDNAANRPYLQVTYTGNLPPSIVATYPPQNYAVPSLTPELLVAANDPDGGGALGYYFSLYDAQALDGPPMASAGPLPTGYFKINSGYLSWGKTYLWMVAVTDGSATSPVSANYFTVQPPQPPVTSRLSQNSGGHGFDPSVGNYTTEVTDAQVATVGPGLSVVRDFNSADPRVNEGFGAGWSSIVDAKAVEVNDSAPSLQGVVVTYPQGQQVMFGRNQNGSFSPPQGRFATFASVTGGGYSLTDKNGTVYRFTQALSSGVYGLTSITDASNRVLTLAYTSGQVTTITSGASGRALHLTWSTPPGATAAHVASVVSDPVVVGSPSTALTWTYTYTGDRLSTVCPPTSTTACASYGYTPISQYPSTVADLGARSYWRLGEASGATTAASAVLANEGSDNGTYANATLGQPGPLPGSSGTAAGFNGTSSRVALQPGVVSNGSYQSVSLWFKTSSNGILFSYQQDPIGQATTANNYTPALYVGTDGKLYGEFWYSGATSPVVSPQAVNNNQWHHVVLAGGGNTQSLYLDGALVGSRSGLIQMYNANGSQNVYVGAGYIGGGWPAEPYQNPNDNTGHPMFFNGSISDVSFYDRWLTGSNVSLLYGTGHTASQAVATVNRPSGNPSAQVAYDPVSGRVAQVSDENGGVWQVGAPTVSGSSQVYASSVMGSGPVDYWRLGDASGATPANQVKGGTAGYSTVTLGTQGVFGSGDDTAAGFNGASSSVSVPGSAVPTNGQTSTELWFNTTHNGAVLYGSQTGALGSMTCPCAPSLWVGTDGKLRGMVPASTPTGPFTSPGVAGKCIDDNNGATANGTHVQVWTCNGGTQQSWTINPDGTIRMYGKCLDLSGYGTTNGTKVQLWDCTGASNQQWQVTNGVLRNPVSGRCLDDPFASTTDGTQLQIWDCQGQAQQQWLPGLASTARVDDGNWHQAVLASDGRTQTLYLDGKKLQFSTDSTTYPTGGQPYTYVGAGATGTGWAPFLPANTTTYVNGAIDELSFYTHGLSTADVFAHYSASRSSFGKTPLQSVNVTDPGNKTIRYDYDALNGNRLVKQTDGLGNPTLFGYDTSGYLYTVTDPNKVVTTTGHDVRGNMVSRTTCQNQPANTCSTSYYTYYPDDTSATLSPDPRNDVVLTMRDGRSASATDNTYLTSYTYDANGNRTSTTTPPVAGFPSGRSTTTTYTDGTSVPAADTGFAPAGLPWKTTTPGGAVTTTTYFHNGDTARAVDPVGLVTNSTYDNLGRRATTTFVSDSYPAGLATTYTYDALDRVLTKTDPGVTDRVTGAVHTGRTTTVYDVDGNATSATIADLTGGDASRTVSWTYNSHGQQVTATDPVSKVTTYGYDVYGNRNSTVDPVGNEADQVFDPNGKLLTTTLKSYTGDPANPSPGQDLVLSSKAYDPAGRLATDTDSMGWVTSYTYTDNGLPATVTRSDPAHGTTYVQQSTSYDAAGNPVSRQSNNGATTINATLDAANRVTSSVLDPTSVNRSTSYSYSPDNAVLSTTVSDANGSAVTDAAYDAAGRMTWRSVHDTSTTPVGRWKLADGTGSVAADSDGNHPGTASAGVGWSAAHGGSATFNGSAAITTSGPAIDTSQSFTVSAWVYLTSTADYAVAVSQPGAQQSSFALLYDAGLNKWGFTRWSDDSATPANHYEAASTSTPAINTWTHLTGVYDVNTHGMTLYVNGTAQGTDNDPTPFKATGPLYIGQGMSAGSPCCNWTGSLSDVQVYNQALSSAQVGGVYGGTLPAAGSMRISTTQKLDQRGLPTSGTDANGNVTLFAYDEAGRLAVTTAPTVNTETNGGTPVASHPVAMVGYDTFGAKVETSDGNGRVTTTAYDAAGRPVSVTLPSYTPPGTSTPIIPVASKTYNNLGQVATTTDPLGHQSSYVYDQLGHVATVTAPNTGITHYTYDTEDDQLSVTDPTGALNQATYDYLGRKATTTQVVRQPSSAAYTTSYAYNTPGGWLSSVTSPGSVTTSYGYDHIGQTTTVTDPASNVTTYSYDFAGRKTKTLLPDGTATTATFDVAGRATSSARLDTNAAVLASRSAAYDPNANPVAFTDARGNTTRYTYDATNKLTSEVQPVTTTTSITTSFGYDAVGNRTRFTDGRGNPFITTYNTWNLPESVVEPSTPAFPNAADRTFTTAYDAGGQVVTQTAPGGVSVTNTYNTVGNLTGQTGTGADAATTARTFGYDTAGRLTSASAPGGTDTFAYDDRGLLLSTTGPSGTSSFAYTSDGLMSSRTDAAGTTSYTYDAADRLKTVQDPATGTQLTLAYNSLSQPTTITYGTGGNVRTYGYDHQHRLTSDSLATNGSTTIASILYGYDPNGNETSKITTGFAGAASNTYTYDFANRLTSWNNGSGTAAYAYDASGNRTQSGSQTFAYNARNQLTTGGGSSYTYTPRGPLATVTTGSTTVTTTNDAFGQTIIQGTQTYSYDALGRVITDATTGSGSRSFTYTGLGNTVAADGTSTYSRDPGGGLVATKTGISGVLAWTDLHTDVVAQFTATGTTLAGSTTYGPLGTVVASSGATGNLGYQSGWTEQSSGRVNMAARWYNPNTGQFDNRDTAGNNPTPDPVAADRYAYANDNPLTVTDPSGHYAIDPEIGDGPLPKGPRPVHHSPRNIGTPRYTTKVSNPQKCEDVECHRAVINEIEDIQRKQQQQIQAALQECRHQVACRGEVQTDVKNGAYQWVNNGDGTYDTTNGDVAVRLTDNDQVAAIQAAQPKPKEPCHGFWGCAKRWAEDHSQLVGAVAGIVVGGLVTGICSALSAGTLTLGCAVLGAVIGGAVAGAVTHGLDVSAGRADGGLGGWITAIGVGAVIGGATAAIGFGVGSFVSGAVSNVIRSAAGSAVQRVATGAVSGAISGGVTGAVTAAGGYGVGCLMGQECTRSGFADAVKGGALIGAGGGALGGAGGGLRGGGRPPAPPRPQGCHSFDPTTPVLLADGAPKPIGDVKLGDKVTSTDPATGKTTAQPVVALHDNHDNDLTDVTLASTPPADNNSNQKANTGGGTVRGPTNTLHTTSHHPFWDATDHNWANAADLRPGHAVTGPEGQIQYVTAVTNRTGRQDMRDLTIAKVHTYYVIAGNVPVLVHNCGDAPAGTPCTCNGPTGFGPNDPPARVQGPWTQSDTWRGAHGLRPNDLGDNLELHHADQMPGSGIHELDQLTHRGPGSDLHQNPFNQGVTGTMRTQDTQLHWWYRSQEMGWGDFPADWWYDK